MCFRGVQSVIASDAYGVPLQSGWKLAFWGSKRTANGRSATTLIDRLSVRSQVIRLVMRSNRTKRLRLHSMAASDGSQSAIHPRTIPQWSTAVAKGNNSQGKEKKKPKKDAKVAAAAPSTSKKK